MVTIPLLVIWLLASWLPEAPIPATEVVVTDGRPRALVMFDDYELDGLMEPEAWIAAIERLEQEGHAPRILAIADMRKPSTEERLYVVDMVERRLVMRTWVAHGQGSGELFAAAFSNTEGSHQTSLGLYRVGAEIVSPKHGKALLLHGLDPGTNCKALEREVIMHGADYVSADFIREHGRLGRSWGCPAVAREQMDPLIEHFAEGGMLFVHY